MTVSDLDGIHHPASISADAQRIVVRHLEFSIDEFLLSGIVLVAYSEDEQRLLEQAGILATRVAVASYKRRNEVLLVPVTMREGPGYGKPREHIAIPRAEDISE